MITVAQAVEDIIAYDDIALAALQKGWLNLSSYARAIQPELQNTLLKDIQEGSIVTALSRLSLQLHNKNTLPTDIIQSLSVHPNLEGMTYERTARLSAKIREMYRLVNVDNKSYLTITQGINEVTIIAESRVAAIFRKHLTGAHKIYDKTDLVGITAKFKVGYLEVPNMIFSLTRRLAFKSVNIIEIVSTATELTFMIERKDLAVALEQLQKDL